MPYSSLVRACWILSLTLVLLTAPKVAAAADDVCSDMEGNGAIGVLHVFSSDLERECDEAPASLVVDRRDFEQALMILGCAKGRYRTFEIADTKTKVRLRLSAGEKVTGYAVRPYRRVTVVPSRD